MKSRKIKTITYCMTSDCPFFDSCKRSLVNYDLKSKAKYVDVHDFQWHMDYIPGIDQMPVIDCNYHLPSEVNVDNAVVVTPSLTLEFDLVSLKGDEHEE